MAGFGPAKWRLVPGWARTGGGRRCQSCVLGTIFVVQQYSLGRPAQIVILARAQSPHECPKPDEAQQDRDWDEDGQVVHGRLPNWTDGRMSDGSSGPGAGASAILNLVALAITKIEENDIANAAKNGVTEPAIAIGTAMAL